MRTSQAKEGRHLGLVGPAREMYLGWWLCSAPLVPPRIWLHFFSTSIDLMTEVRKIMWKADKSPDARAAAASVADPWSLAHEPGGAVLERGAGGRDGMLALSRGLCPGHACGVTFWSQSGPTRRSGWDSPWCGLSFVEPETRKFCLEKMHVRESRQVSPGPPVVLREARPRLHPAPFAAATVSC